MVWSYSGIKTFEQCPRKFFHLKEARDIKDSAGEAALYGTLVHTAAEEFIRDGTPIPEAYAYMVPIMEKVAALRGDKHTEIKLGVRKRKGGYSPCDFDDPQAWWHGIADLLAMHRHRAWLLDYKTGKNFRYADPRQLDMLAGATFVKYPAVHIIKGALIYVNTGDVLEKTYVRVDTAKYLRVFDVHLDRLDIARARGVWSPKSSPLCGWCPVESCLHWRERR